MQTEAYIIDKKTIALGSLEHLEPEDEKKSEEIGNTLGPLLGKNLFTFQIYS
ncbi:hypothetical protein [Bacillus pseudomycoides]|uniref:hypothetical protein n=1 Tax=Bacillus pseudomycoides TaxID=64104 RepID=UPI0003A8E35B|nr:hypothetical protein [Bacillus pseudomycoides]